MASIIENPAARHWLRIARWNEISCAKKPPLAAYRRIEPDG
jgi:hypothetical protein